MWVIYAGVYIFWRGVEEGSCYAALVSYCTQAGCPALASRAVGYWCMPPHVAGVVVKCFLTIGDDCGSVLLCDPPRGCLLGI